MKTTMRANVLLAIGLAAMISRPVLAGTYVNASETNGLDVINHPTGYDGSGADLVVDVCIELGTVDADLMEIGLENTISTLNKLIATHQNLQLDEENNVPATDIDWESVMLHELGHCIGLGHVNLASESGLPSADQDYTKSTEGADMTYDLDPGTDGTKGSKDDLRDDDDNLHWFRKSNNDPFTIDAGVIDSTTYSRDLLDLPSTHDYVANADRTVGEDLGHDDTEAVMNQGTLTDEMQHMLNHDDVATLRYAMTGLDEIEGTDDDYTFTLNYVGQTSNCDIVVAYDDAETDFAVCKPIGVFIDTTDHVEIISAEIFFNTNWSWFYNPVRNCMATIDHDLGHDLHADILMRKSNGLTFLYEMDGLTVRRSGKLKVSKNTSYEIIDAADLDGDGRAEIIMRNKNSGNWYVYFMQGSTVVRSNKLKLNKNLAWEFQGMGDLDGDGRADIVLRNSDDGRTFAYLMTGELVASSGLLAFNPDPLWELVAIADIDGDGRDDVVFRKSSNGATFVYFMDGLTVASSGVLSGIKTDTDWKVADAGDLNADCRADLVLRNSTTNQSYGYLLDGLTIASEGSLAFTAGASWEIAGVADLDADGNRDVLFRNSGNGKTYGYLMDGLTVSSEGFIPINDDLAWTIVSP